MIVLDEQLLGYGLQNNFARWYRGTVTDITQLRPGTVIEDDAIPVLLRAARQPTFITINVQDFWRKLAPDRRFCIACFAIPDSRADEIPDLLRRLYAEPPFRTRLLRLGKMTRVSQSQVQYYTVESSDLQRIEW
jgi:hypothetical protein